ncbi:MAG: NAD(P)/FAD-dependent oxidoreductase [Vicinamibacterales bacterium]
MIVVVGGGAAGLMAAIAASERGAAVTLVERTTDGGRKILISGGGRCNVLPSAIDPHRFVSDSPPHLVRGLLRSWPLDGQRTFFEHDLGIPLALEAETGKLFPVSNRARDVRDGLVGHARRLGATLVFETLVTGVEGAGDVWTVRTSRGDYTARAVILATGGLSVPATGSDGTGLRLSASLGLKVHDTYPALTPLIAEPARHAALAGVSAHARVRARADGRSVDARGGLLFTHRGYSGPAILDVSHAAVRSLRAGKDAALRVQWSEVDARSWEQAIAASNGLVTSVVARVLPQRLAAALVAESHMPLDRRASELRRRERVALIERLTAYALPVTGDEGYKKAEVTGGGIALDEIDPRTLECRARAGLFLCGELLDAFGPIGGHNFAWAWATGRAAGIGAALRNS